MDLTTYLQNLLGTALINQLGLDSGFFTAVVTDVLDLCSAVVETDITDQLKLRTLGRMKLWELAMVRATTGFDFNADGASYKTSQIFDFCQKNYRSAITDALKYLPGYTVTVKTFPVSGSSGSCTDGWNNGKYWI